MREGFYVPMCPLSSVSLDVNYRVLVLLSDRPLSQKLVNLPRVPRASDDCMSRLKVLGHPPCCCYCDKLAQRERRPWGSGLTHCGNLANVVRKDFSFHTGSDPESRREAMDAQGKKLQWPQTQSVSDVA